MTSENYLSSRIAVDKSPLELPLECAKALCNRDPWAVRPPALDPTDEREKETELAQLSQLRTFYGFFALIFVVKPCVSIVAL